MSAANSFFLTNQLTTREVQQLQRSLQSRSIREVALTVCTIKSLAAEVKTILHDLFSEEEETDEILKLEQNSEYDAAASDRSISDMMSTQSNIPAPEVRLSTPSLLVNEMPGIVASSTVAGAQRVRMKYSNRPKCPDCNKYFASHRALNNHLKSVHLKMLFSKHPEGSPVYVPEVANTSVKESTVQASESVPDISVTSSKRISSAFMSYPEQTSQSAHSVKDHPSPPSSETSDGLAHVKMENMLVPNDIQVDIAGEGASSVAAAEPGFLISVFSGAPTQTVHLKDDQRAHEMSIRLETDKYLEKLPYDGYYRCTHCMWKSKLHNSMRAHILLHRGIMPHSCSQCGYQCSRKASLVRHMTTHTGPVNK